MNLESGIIKKNNYLNLVASDLFKGVEKFSDSFLARNKSNLSEYYKTWGDDSLHLWSRQYEYLYFFQEIKAYVESNPGKQIKILDAGSGLTFFPYILSETFSNVEVVCTDYDSILNRGYSLVNKTENRNIKFVQGDLRHKVFSDKEFDIIYCVSVLEHTDEYPKIVDNMHEYLKENGKLILSFDISIDGYADISYEGSKKLIAKLNEKFSPKVLDSVPPLSELASGKEYLNMDFFKSYDKNLLPWRSPYKNFLKCIKDMKLPPKFIFNLACYCQTYTKK